VTATDPELQAAWSFVQQGVAAHDFGLEQLRDALISGHELGGNVSGIERQGDRVLVYFGDAEATCQVAELLALVNDAIAEHAATGTPEDTPGPDPEPEPASTLAERLGAALGLDLEELAGGDLDKFMKTLGRVVQELQSDEPGARDRARDQARAIAADLKSRGIAGAERLASLPELLQTAQDQLDTERLAGNLRTLADWLEDQDSESGKKVDEILGALESGLGKVLGSKARQDAEQDERIRTDARSSIANALRNLGLKVDPPDR